MEKLYKLLKPFAKPYIILLTCALTLVNFYFIVAPLKYYATSKGMPAMPVVLDSLDYYTPDEGYKVLTKLGVDGRAVYRLVNYADFVLPILLFLSLSLSGIAFGQGHRYLILTFIYMISEYFENISEKYVLEIYPERNDLIMRLACYSGLLKLAAFVLAFLILVLNVLQWICTWPFRPSRKKNQQKVQ